MVTTTNSRLVPVQSPGATFIYIEIGFPCEMEFSLHKSPNPTESLATRVGFGDEYVQAGAKLIRHRHKFNGYSSVERELRTRWRIIMITLMEGQDVLDTQTNIGIHKILSQKCTTEKIKPRFLLLPCHIYNEY